MPPRVLTGAQLARATLLLIAALALAEATRALGNPLKGSEYSQARNPACGLVGLARLFKRPDTCLNAMQLASYIG